MAGIARIDRRGLREHLQVRLISEYPVPFQAGHLLQNPSGSELLHQPVGGGPGDVKRFPGSGNVDDRALVQAVEELDRVRAEILDSRPIALTQLNDRPGGCRRFLGCFGRWRTPS